VPNKVAVAAELGNVAALVVRAFLTPVEKVFRPSSFFFCNSNFTFAAILVLRRF
jgi:hypothetical protein